MSETYLITGGAGNLACRTTFAIAQSNREIVLADIAENPVVATACGCQYIRCDLADYSKLRHLFEQFRPAVILHFASLLSGKSEQDRRTAWRINMDATFELFEMALTYGARQILFPSSVASYGGPLPNPLPEDFPQWPLGLYGVTKQSVERLGVYYHTRHGLDFRALRVPIVLSPHAAHGAASAYASRAIIEAFNSGQFQFEVTRATTPALIYIDDVIQAILALLNAPEARLTRRVYNIYAFSPTAEELAGAIGKRLPSARFDFQPDSSLAQLIESWPIGIVDESARHDWGWNPKFNLETAVNAFLAELQSKPG
jgi:threonine 3-dehydrogenase